MLVRRPGWRRRYIVMAIAHGLLTALGVEVLSALTAWQKAELFAVLAGTTLLALGLAGWYRERDRQSDFVSFALAAGSLLIGVPLAVASALPSVAAAFAATEGSALATAQWMEYSGR
jgi:hypothetical protein